MICLILAIVSSMLVSVCMRLSEGSRIVAVARAEAEEAEEAVEGTLQVAENVETPEVNTDEI